MSENEVKPEEKNWNVWIRKGDDFRKSGSFSDCTEIEALRNANEMNKLVDFHEHPDVYCAYKKTK
jgi:hypothetical protein